MTLMTTFVETQQSLIPDLKTYAACALRGMDMNASEWGFQHFSDCTDEHGTNFDKYGILIKVKFR